MVELKAWWTRMKKTNLAWTAVYMDKVKEVKVAMVGVFVVGYLLGLLMG